jgi:hypothetical protein
MKTVGQKQVYDNNLTWTFTKEDGGLAAAYIPNLAIDDQLLWQELSKLNFTRVHYISRYSTPNRTPRLTWAYGQVNANRPNPDFDPSSPADQTSKLRSLPNPEVANQPSIVSYRGLEFQSEIQPLTRVVFFARAAPTGNYIFLNSTSV